MDKQTQNELLAIVKKNYEEIAADYNETRKKHLEPLWHDLIRLAKEAKDGCRILDVGCGNGRLLEAYLGKEIFYLGVDSNPSLLEFARERYPGRKFTTGDILTLGQVPEVDFDYIFSIALIHHLPGQSTRVDALKQLKNKLSESGRIVITVWNMWSVNKINMHHNFRRLLFRYALLKLIGKNRMDWGDVMFTWKNPKGERTSQRYYHAFTKHQLKKIARLANLRVEKIYKDKFNYYLVASK